MLSTLAQHVARGEISAHLLVLLTDRVPVGTSKPQRYGGQLIAQQCHWVPKPIEDPNQVDVGRASLGEMPLADYVCVAAQRYPTP
ncbi:hypothetical protein XpopCFBP1817_16305 [Xanthomonas populi]|uniref:Uncharacterized protein n=1 Tax=Xanthomonas populi TaxID=53414 RepID=A0A2S7EKU0_9XANT|nr:DUF6624 domain-containing protein [Xanthomonas populi]PPU90826.1 hypothetical protein XpopCFBP1817_16305 [Xanthomonas populi]